MKEHGTKPTGVRRLKTSLFQKYPEFIDTDPRVTRTSAYSIDKEFMQSRHAAMFNFDLTDKRVLDLGSCVGATGAWVLEHGASQYHGVEFHTDLASISESNLKTYFDQSLWKVFNTSIDSFLSTRVENYDVVIASGVLYSFFDPIPFLKKLLSVADMLIVESVHPRQIPELRSDYHLEETPFIVFDDARKMMWGAQGQEVSYPGSEPSLGFLKYFFKLHGFDYDSHCYEQLKINCPGVYNRSKRYVARFIKNSNISTSLGFTESYKNE